MTALQKIAMGLVIVVLSAEFRFVGHAPFIAGVHRPDYGWDVLPNPVGWVMVLVGLRALAVRPRVRTAAWVALAASVVAYPLPVLDRMDDATQWWLSQPQVIFLVLLCYEIPELAGGAKRRSFLSVGSLVLLADIGLVAYLGAGVEALGSWVALLTYVADFWLIWLLFSVSRGGQKSQVT